MTPPLLLASVDATVAIAGGIVTIIMSIGGAIWASAVRSGTSGAKLKSLTESRHDHETRLRSVEEKVTRIDANVSWIKQALVNVMSRSERDNAGRGGNGGNGDNRGDNRGGCS